MRRHGSKRVLLAAGLVTAFALVTAGCDWVGYRNGAARTGANLSEDGAQNAIGVNNAGSLHAVQTIDIPGYSGSTFAGGTPPPIEAEGKIWVNGTDGILHVLNGSGAQVAAVDLQADLATASTPTAAGGVVYVTRASLIPGDSKLFAIDAKTHQEKWQVTLPALGAQNDATPAVADGFVFVNIGQKVSQYSLSGALVRDHNAPGYVSTPPVVQNGVLYFGAANGRVTAKRISDGLELWDRPCPDTCRATEGIAAAGDKLIVSRDGGNLLAQWTSNGTVAWKAKNKNGTPVDARTAPAVAYGKVYIGSGNGGVKIFDLNNGEFVAGNEDGYPSDVTVANGVVYTANPLRAYRADNAAALKNTGFQGPGVNEAVVSNGRVLQMNGSGQVVVFDT